jgi:hypothetical protein
MKWILFIALGLSSCGPGQPQAPTAEQNQQLNEAGAMLDELAANEEGPATEAADPSIGHE